MTRRQKLKREALIQSVFAASYLIIAITSALIVATTLYQGRTRLNGHFLWMPSSGSGYEGGIRYQLLGTLILMATTALTVTPFATGLALVHTQFAKAWLKNLIATGLHMLNATPSILFGVLGYLFFYHFLRWEKSWLSGGLILALMILPTVTLSLIERIQTIPSEYVEVSRGLGLTQEQLIARVILPYSQGGLLTGLVLGISRAAGETAPILFTAAVMAGATVPTGIKDSPVLALPYHIFNVAQDTFGKGAMENAWSTAAVLLLVSFSFSLLAIPLRARSHEEAKTA